MQTLTLTEAATPITIIDPVTGMTQQIEHPPRELFRFNFDTIDPERIQQVIAILLAPAKKRRSDYGKPKPRPGNGTQPELPAAT